MSVYVYAIVGTTHPLDLDGATGVGEKPLRAVPGGSVVAVVSESPGELRVRRRDLAAHQHVLVVLSRQGTVLPIRFGLTCPDDATIAAELRRHSSEYEQRLWAVENQVEFNLRAARDKRTVLREVLRTSSVVRRLNASTQDGGGTEQDRIELGKAISAEVAARNDHVKDQIVRQLDPLARSQVVGDPIDDVFLNVSFLVERSRAAEFEAAARGVAHQHTGQGVRCRLHGPLPPYSFV
jgi:hypothetical protein